MAALVKTNRKTRWEFSLRAWMFDEMGLSGPIGSAKCRERLYISGINLSNQLKKD
jgi:hypothetical protein